MGELSISSLMPAILVFASAFFLTVAIGQGLANWRFRRIAKREAQRLGGGRDLRVLPGSRQGRAVSPRISAILRSLSNLALPAGGWQDNKTRLKFLRAGLRQDKTEKLYFSIKAVLFIAPPALAFLVWTFASPDISINWMATGALGLAAIGYYGPDAYLNWRTTVRQTEMRNVLPDLIDLLVICTESGLALDQAIHRVAREIERSSPALAEEFYLLTLEVRAGAGRASALRNLALRAGIAELDSLVSMLIQADRFGTSIADALRIQSEISRTKRMQRAEEMAAKIPTKMLLPLIFLIFPALMIVLLGPAGLQIMTEFSD